MANSKLEEFLDSLSEQDRAEVIGDLVAKVTNEAMALGMVDEEAAPEPEIIDETQWISGDYLSAACKMIALQFSHRHFQEWPKDADDLHEQCTRMMRQHCPIAYSYYFTNSHGANVIPTGTVDIIKEYIYATPEGKDFMGGKHSGIILP